MFCISIPFKDDYRLDLPIHSSSTIIHVPKLKKNTNTCYLRPKYNIFERISLVNWLGTQCTPTLQEWLSDCLRFRYWHTLVSCIFLLKNKFRSLGEIANILLLIFSIINHVLIICIKVWDRYRQLLKIYIIHFVYIYWNDTWHVDTWKGASFQSH